MPRLETDEGAEKRTSEYKKRIEKRQEETFNKNVKRIRVARQKSDEERTRLGRQVSKSDDEEISKIVKPKIKIDKIIK